MSHSVSEAERNLLNRVGLQAVQYQRGTYVQPYPGKTLSKSVVHNFDGSRKPGKNKTVIGGSRPDGLVPWDEASCILYFHGPCGPWQFSLAAQYAANKPHFRTYEEAEAEGGKDLEFQKTDADILEQQARLRQAKINKAERSGLAVMRPGDAVAPLVEAIQALTAQNTQAATRGPGRPSKSQGTDE